jgi:hypothetical protein
MADDYRTSLGPFVPVQSAETLRRLLAYLGAAPAQVADFDCVVADVGKALSGSRFSRSARTCCASVIGRICEIRRGGDAWCHAPGCSLARSM